MTLAVMPSVSKAAMMWLNILKVRRMTVSFTWRALFLSRGSLTVSCVYHRPWNLVCSLCFDVTVCSPLQSGTRLHR